VIAELLGVPLERDVKCLMVYAQDRVHMLLIRGDRMLNEVKVGKLPGFAGWRWATDAEIVDALEAAQLGHLVPRLDEEAHWSNILSGGEQQRVAAARALIGAPQIIVADEPTSALDVSVQAQILELLRETVKSQNLSMLFISHDLAVVQQLCRSVFIFRDGKIEDSGPCDEVFSTPRNPYTRSLIDARPRRFTN